MPPRTTSWSRSAATPTATTELRPELMRRTIVAFQDAGVEADVWKIEGIDTRRTAT